MRRRNAFTLLEILVVVAILTLLLAIIFPAFAGARRQARRTACLTNLSSVAKAIQTYATANSSRLPVASYNRVPYGAKKDSDDDSWKVLNPFLTGDGYGVLQCPCDHGNSPDSDTTEFADRGFSYFYVADYSGNYKSERDALREQGIVEITGSYVPYFEENLGSSPGPLRQDVENAGQSSSFYSQLKSKAAKYANKQGAWIPDLETTYSSGSKRFWKHEVRTIDYWRDASRKVCLVDWDAFYTGAAGNRPTKGFWHEYPWTPDPAARTNMDKATVRVHAAFLDGHAGTIELNKYNKLPEEERVDRTKHAYY